MTVEANVAQAQQAAAPSEPVVALIPRINISAFCDDPGTAQAMQVVAGDRRMMRAHVDVQLGGISGAIQAFSSSKTPNVIIVESLKPREGLLSDLGHLSHVCDPTTKVIVIGHVNDVILYRELVSQGISEYLVAPLHPLQIVEALGKMFQDPDAAPVGKVLAFIGSKGGVGSSLLAHNVGWLLSKEHAIDTVITDLDLAFGTAGLNLNQDAAQGIAEALGSPERVDQVLIDRLLTKCSERLSLLAAPSSIERDVPIESQSLDTILDVVRANVPCVVIDVPNVWAPWTKQVLIQADEVILTATPELASLRNGKNLIDLLKTARPNDRPPRLVLNQVGLAKRPEIPAAEFAKAIGVEPTLVIPFDGPIFGAAISNGQMLAEVSAKSKPAQAVAELALILAGREAPATGGKSALAPLLEKLSMLRKK